MIWAKLCSARRRSMIYSTQERPPTHIKYDHDEDPSNGETETRDHLFQWIWMRLNSDPLGREKATATTAVSQVTGLQIARRDERQDSHPSQQEDPEDRHDVRLEDQHVSTSGPLKTTPRRQKTSSWASGITRPTSRSLWSSP